MTEQDSCLLDVCFFIGQELHARGQNERAEYWYNRALKFNPEEPEVHHALSYLATEKKDFNAVVAHSTHAMKGSNGNLAQYNRALALLMLGKYKQGFIDLDARLHFDITERYVYDRFGDLLRWDGGDCDILYVVSEQGYGDIFQFCRYVPLITERFNVKKVIFEVSKECHRLLSYNFNSDKVEVIPLPEKIPKIDAYVCLLSLAKIFDTRITTIPPLLLKSPGKTQTLGKNLKVGLVWSGRDAYGDVQIKEWNERRSLTLEQLDPILSIPGIDFISLQLGSAAREADNYSNITKVKLNNWSDTACWMEGLDLLITIDSGPAHLGGAMQIPVWLLQHASPCWRYGLHGDHTPWYTDKLTQFRQKQDGDWVPVIEKITQKLHNLVWQRKAA